MAVSDRRIVILGKTGVGKSSLANTIFGEKAFKIDNTANSETSKCEAKTKSVNGRSITLIDTPGFFDTYTPDDELKPEIVRCITECAPGPHAFLIVLEVNKFTELEQAVINKMCQYFNEEIFRYSTVVFTRGDQLSEGQTIEEYFHQNKLVRDLMKKCGGRCHVIDNKYWIQKPKHEYRSNQFQVEELLKTIEKMVMENKGSYYTNEMLQAVEEEIEQEEENIRLLQGNMSEEEIRKQAKDRVFKKLLIKLTGVGVGVLLGAFFGVVGSIGIVVIAAVAVAKGAAAAVGTAVGTAAGTAAGTAVAAGAGVEAAGAAAGAAAAVAAGGAEAAAAVSGGIAAGVVFGTSAAVGAVCGGVRGYRASERAETPGEAAKIVAESMKNDVKYLCNKATDILKEKEKKSLKF